jgi:eukaryotic-like serine/threonine-protein kinase
VCSGCLSERTLFGLIEGRLSESSFAAAMEHVNTCEECRTALAETAKFLLAQAGEDERDRAQSLATVVERPLALSARSHGFLERGRSVGRYVVRRRVGNGGMGVVYEAHDPELNRNIALKLMRSEYSEHGDFRVAGARLSREARAMAQLVHPNVVVVYDVGHFEGQLFIAMEYVEGQTLRSWLHTRPRSWADVARVFSQAGSGLAAAHAAGVVHRDFKPENVLVTHDERVKVSDFGLARDIAESEAAETGSRQRPAWGNDPAATLTRTGVLKGTPAYMAPELLVDLPADARTDQFSFCVALYEALYGFRPFQADSFEELATAIVEGKMVSPPPGLQGGQHQSTVFSVRFSLARCLACDALIRSVPSHWINNRGL